MSGAGDETRRLRAALQVAWTLVGPVANALEEEEGGRELSLACDVFRRTLGENMILAEIEQLEAQLGSVPVPRPGELKEALDRLTREVTELRAENELLRRGTVTGLEDASRELIPPHHPAPGAIVERKAAGGYADQEAYLRALGAVVPWLPAASVPVAENAFRCAARDRLFSPRAQYLSSEDGGVAAGFATLASIAGIWGTGAGDGRLFAEVRWAWELARSTRAYLKRVVRGVPGVNAALPFEVAADLEWRVEKGCLVWVGDPGVPAQLQVSSRRSHGAVAIVEAAPKGGPTRTFLLHTFLEV